MIVYNILDVLFCGLKVVCVTYVIYLNRMLYLVCFDDKNV